MTVEYFNSFGGFSAGIPPTPVIDSNGNVVSNFNNLSGNVSANKVYANNYYFSNGLPFTSNAGGSNTQLQYNNNGNFAGVSTTSFDGSVLTLGDSSTVSILGGINGYFLQTDGAGNLSWSPAGNSTGGNGTPGGANTQVQFNDEGNFGGNTGFTFNKLTGTLYSSNINAAVYYGDASHLSGVINTANYVVQPVQSNITSVGTLTSLNVSGNAALGDISNVHITGGFNGYVMTTDGHGNLTWEAIGNGGGGSPGGANTQIQFNANGSFGGASAFTYNNISNAVTLTGNMTVQTLTANNATLYGNANVTGNVTATYFHGDGSYLANIQTETANYVSQSYQPNITSVGTMTSLSVSGNILSSQTVSAASFQTAGTANVGNIRVTAFANVPGTLNVTGTVVFSNSSNVTLGNASNIHITGGLNGYVLTTDGLGQLSWQPAAGGANGTPGGTNTQVQFNNDGNFAASPYFTFDSTSNTVQVGGKLIANTMQLGSGGYKFCSSYVSFNTSATTAKTNLYSIPVTDCAGVDFDIIATCSADEKRQTVKVTSAYYAGQVQYAEYGGLYINGGIGDFIVEYNPGNVITSPSLDLNVIPNTSNPVVYKMLISVLAP